MNYVIKFYTFAPSTTGGGVISNALGFEAELSHGTLIDIFAADLPHRNGVFKSKKAAKIVADKINKRNAFGGFGEFAVFAEVVKA